MQSPTYITFFSLLKKYGGNIKRAHPLELRAAAKATPKNSTALKELFDASREYRKELSGQRPAGICFNTDQLCDDERCYCDK